MSSFVDSIKAGNAATNASTSKPVASAAEAGDRFLRLLVAQMKNQDPLNPLDNAQVTSQMAQISTVQGVEKLNASLQEVTGQVQRMQALQGASLVGTRVLVPGDRIGIEADGLGRGAYELAGAADSVRVEILSSAGEVLGTLNQGAQSNGQRGFEWTPPQGLDPSRVHSFRVTATKGSAPVGAVSMMRDQVGAVQLDGLATRLSLARFGTVSLADVKAFN